jgi:hypothetical protein
MQERALYNLKETEENREKHINFILLYNYEVLKLLCETEETIFIQKYRFILKTVFYSSLYEGFVTKGLFFEIMLRYTKTH